MTTATHDERPTPLGPTDATPRLMISTACLSGTLEDKLRAAASSGFQGVELLEYDLVMSPWGPRRVRDEAAGLGLTVDVYQPFHVEAVAPSAFDASLRRAELKFDVLEELGAGIVLACSSMSADGVDDDDLAAAQLHALGERAERRGLRIAYEAVPWGRVRTHDHAWRIIQRADHPAVGLCLDSFHVLSEGGDARRIRSVPGSRVFHVQLADAPGIHMDIPEWSLHRRLFPGQGSLDLPGFVRQLLAEEYAGPMAVEVFNDIYQQADPRHTAIDAMRAVLVLMEAVSRHDAGVVGQHVPTGSLPPSPRLDGFAFVEFAVDHVSGPLVAQALATLGFHHAAQHRSKPVQLWQQGGARILLNSAPQRSIGAATAAITALGVGTADPALSTRRAERLLAPQLPRIRHAHEVQLSSVAAPDGTAVFLCGTGGVESWLDDFAPAEPTAPGDAWVRDIDHVSLTESIDDFDQTALFYRSVLGLVPGRTTETTAPFGLVRSWSASDASGRVRITLDTAPLRHGDWAPAVANAQHVAFSTDDAIARAKAMAEGGAPLLAIPGNYYDDLDARAELPREVLNAMREHSVLYDRDERGEYLHFFTEMLGSRVFFEVVQRIGGYAGSGAASSTPLRMAAHRRQRLRMLTGTQPEDDGEHRHEYSLAHLTALSLSPPELVDAASAAGYRYVGLRLTKVTPVEPHYPLAYDPRLMRATKTHLAATGIEVLDVELARITSDDSPRDYVRFLEAGAELGARHVITQLPDADFSRKTDRFAQLCDLAAPLGLTIDLEFPSWTETPGLTDAARVLRAADRPNAGILVDLLHFARSGSRVEDLLELPAAWFHFVQVCDAPAEMPDTVEGVIHTARFERLFPGEGGLDVGAILAALPSGIPYALEIPRAELVAQVGAREHARLALSAARRSIDLATPPPERSTGRRSRSA